MTLLATTAGTALLVGLKTQGGTVPSQTVADAPLDPGQPTQSTTATAAPVGPSRSAIPNGSAKASTKPTPVKSAPATKTAAPTKKPATRTIVGTAFPAVGHGENYGDMQVKIVVTGSHIDKVATIQESNRPRNVASVLGAKAISLQSANVGNVSGATASSDAYKKSLQSAINQI
jgi:uncharacterized protein with FMN-binding domain